MHLCGMQHNMTAEEVPDEHKTQSRRRERFGAGELLEVLEVKGSESLVHSSFRRINGLRPQSAVECQYTIESEEFDQKTEIVK